MRAERARMSSPGGPGQVRPALERQRRCPPWEMYLEMEGNVPGSFTGIS